MNIKSQMIPLLPPIKHAKCLVLGNYTEISKTMRTVHFRDDSVRAQLCFFFIETPDNDIN